MCAGTNARPSPVFDAQNATSCAEGAVLNHRGWSRNKSRMGAGLSKGCNPQQLAPPPPPPGAQCWYLPLRRRDCYRMHKCCKSTLSCRGSGGRTRVRPLHACHPSVRRRSLDTGNINTQAPARRAKGKTPPARNVCRSLWWRPWLGTTISATQNLARNCQ